MMEVVRNQDIRPLRCVDTGDGPALVLLHGFAMQPETYLPLARLLTDRIRVVIPAIFALPGRWIAPRRTTTLESDTVIVGQGPRPGAEWFVTANVGDGPPVLPIRAATTAPARPPAPPDRSSSPRWSRPLASSQ